MYRFYKICSSCSRQKPYLRPQIFGNPSNRAHSHRFPDHLAALPPRRRRPLYRNPALLARRFADRRLIEPQLRPPTVVLTHSAPTRARDHSLRRAAGSCIGAAPPSPSPRLTPQASERGSRRVKDPDGCFSLFQFCRSLGSKDLASLPTTYDGETSLELTG